MGDTPEVVKHALAGIGTGAFDGHLVNVIEFARRRLTEGPTAARWSVSCTIADGDASYLVEVTEDSLTVAEAELAEIATGSSWGNLHPIRSASANRAIIQAALMHRHKLQSIDAHRLAGALTVVEATNAFTQYEVDAVPTSGQSTSS